MQKQSLYKNLARYYDLLYSFKDYKKESEILRRLIAKSKKSKGRDLLEVACGTGKHAQCFKDDFKVLATDLNRGMLAHACKNVKDVTFKQADMLNLNLNREFDVILCLFSSIGYVKTLANVRKVLRNFALHLKKGGVVVIEPWFTKEGFRPGFVSMTTYNGGVIKIARLCVAKVRGDVSVMDMHYLIAEQNKTVRHFVDRHELGMFEPEKFIRLMEQAGLVAKFEPAGLMKDRGLYVGVKK